ncbi:MAG: hypothetical protein A2V92_00130 [Candidatus Muproteobacteria bacterium RBG_16_65_31]|uniref:SPOR domain-containing protein n=1 Tax=Candidatus Muproteobacteria bacterium RBG_16_65_31 TaxID=1817759 RepID=A0A1F6TBN0_9PROT|nr:MAG: hypothetical protein A2V92_00130 [Candidatus Muproteobacteria bacterium RBG_16_65_31]
MKWFFAALVLANIGLWMWAQWYKNADMDESLAPRPPIAADRMRLLSEPGVRPRPRPPRPPAAALCHRIGPFAAAQSAGVASARLAESQIGSDLREERRELVSGYRVFLPPFPSKAAAERRRQELTHLGFKDHALIQEDKMRNAISLGLFSVEANARAHVKRLVAKGVKAKLEPTYKASTSYWLEIKPGDFAPEKLRQQNWGQAGIEVRETACPAPPLPDAPPAPADKADAPAP